MRINGIEIDLKTNAITTKTAIIEIKKPRIKLFWVLNRFARKNPIMEIIKTDGKSFKAKSKRGFADADKPADLKIT